MARAADPSACPRGHHAFDARKVLLRECLPQPRVVGGVPQGPATSSYASYCLSAGSAPSGDH
eukprot:5354693-Amphidinium_carterae.1